MNPNQPQGRPMPAAPPPPPPMPHTIEPSSVPRAPQMNADAMPASTPMQPMSQQMPQQMPMQYGPPQQQMPMQPMQPGGVQQAPMPQPNKTSTQNALEIAEIRDGIVIMNDGSFRAVVMCQSINFDLMSPDEREAVEYSYQGFLNSLYFDVQIFMRSQKVDLRPYLEKLDKIRAEHDNMLLALLMEDYIQYMAALAEQTNIMDKKFYVIIDFHPLVDAQKAVKASKSFFSTILGKKEQRIVVNERDLEAAKTELKNRIQTVMAGLQQCGVTSIPLDTQELIELYYDAYNPDTATRQQLKDFNGLTAPVVTKGQGQAVQPGLNRELQ